MKICPDCGAPIPADAPAGLCIACLLKLAQTEINPAPNARAHTLGALERQVGDYELIREIGRGGMGVVYEARQMSLNRPVALKLILGGEFASEAAVARFKEEADVIGRLAHPNIVPIYEIGEDQGTHFFSMKLIVGESIAQRLDRGGEHNHAPLKEDDNQSGSNLSQKANLPSASFSPRESAVLLAKVARAVHFAHQCGIIHRDLSPENILLDAQGEPTVTDFGLARLVDRDRRLTQTNALLGKPDYMAPEQVDSRGPQATIASDIFSLGAILYQLITGHRPFAAETPLATLERIRNFDPAPPCQLNPVLDRDLETICLKCLSKAPAGRYSSAEALAEDMERWMRCEPILARPPSNTYRLYTFARRNKLAFAAIAALLTAVLGGLTVSTSLYFQEKAALKLAQREAERSRQVARFLKDMVQGVGPSVAKGQDTKMLREILDKTATRLHSDLTNQPIVEAELLHTIGEVYLELGLFDPAEKMHREALTIRSRLLGSAHPDVAQSRNSLGSVLWQAGKWEEGEFLIREALAMRRKALGNEHADLSESINNLAIVLSQQGKLAEAESLDREALAMRRKLFGAEHTDVALSLANLAIDLDHQGKVAEAESLGREALTMRRNLLGKEHPDLAKSLDNLAVTLAREDKLVEAESLNREALTMRRKLFGNDHPELALSLVTLAGFLTREGKLAEAESLNREALTMRRKLLGNEHPEVANSLDSLAVTLALEGKLVEAESMGREALTILRKLFGDEHWEVASVCNDIVHILLLERKYSEAEVILNEILTPAFQGRLESAGLLRSRAEYFAHRGRWKAAAADMAKVVEFEPSNHMNYHLLAPLLIASENFTSLHRLCQRIVTEFSGTTNVLIAERMAKDCLIVPSSDLAMLTAAVAFAGTAVSLGISNQYLAYIQCTKGLAEYRQGHFADAVDWTGKTIDAGAHRGGSGWDDNLSVEAYSISALAHFRLQQVDEARNALAKAIEIAERKLAKPDSDDLGDGWPDWVFAHTLMREAKELIEGRHGTVK